MKTNQTPYPCLCSICTKNFSFSDTKVKIKAALINLAIPYWVSQFIWVIWRANRETAINSKTVKHFLCLWIQIQPRNSLPWLMK